MDHPTRIAAAGHAPPAAGADGGAAADPVRVEADLRRRLFWRIVATGFALPWVVGIVVKLTLQLLGRLTWPWLELLRLLPMFVLFSVWFASPFIALAFVGRHLLRRPDFLGLDAAERRLTIQTAFACGALATVVTFVPVFWHFDPFVFVAVPLPLVYALAIAVGLPLGVLAALGLRLWRRHWPPSWLRRA